MTNVLIVAGHSGSGKSYLAKELEEKFNFNRLKQVTTRPRREGEEEDAYDFITDELYDKIKDTLFGKTEFNGYRYGTYRTLEINKNNVVVLNKKGIEDFKKQMEGLGEQVIDNTIILGLKIKEGKREGRNLEQENLDILSVIDYLLTADTYIDTIEILEYLENKTQLNLGLRKDNI
jgi:guanylate kinase